MAEEADEYQVLRNRVDLRSIALTQIHSRHLACKPGCHDCCTDFSVFPVEYVSILRSLKEANVQLPPPDPAAACAFLQNGLCSIYAHRPLICRTHGLPIAFTSEDEEAKNVDFCPKNFTDIPPGELSFDADTTLDLDQMNFELHDLHAGYTTLQPASPARVPLRKLHDDLSQA